MSLQAISMVAYVKLNQIFWIQAIHVSYQNPPQSERALLVSIANIKNFGNFSFYFCSSLFSLYELYLRFTTRER